jgi:hypothetical protein
LLIFFVAESNFSSSFFSYYQLLLIPTPDYCLQLRLRKRTLHFSALTQYDLLYHLPMNSFQMSQLMIEHFSSKLYFNYFFHFISSSFVCNLFEFHQILSFEQAKEYLLNSNYCQLFIFFIEFLLRNHFLDQQFVNLYK